jgi:phosphoribosyl 1,2-cyclic phosphodiesterase
MALHITSLNSGSNGNCYYIGNSTTAVLVDVGISCREVEKRMKKLGLPLKNVKAIFISHEHGDHIKGVTTLANKYKLPVYISTLTAKNGPRLISHLSKLFVADEQILIDDLLITPFSKKHDAIDPYSFIIEQNNICVGVFTDIGVCCDNVKNYFKKCNAIFLESNYDEDMLENGRYPIHLKNRIRGGHGHLSNKEAVELFIQHKGESLSHIILSHLSKENNTPQLAKELFLANASDTLIEVASRYEATEIFTITNGTTYLSLPKKTEQLQLF